MVRQSLKPIDVYDYDIFYLFLSCGLESGGLRDPRVSPYLLAPVDDILSIGQPIDAGTSNNRVVTRRGVCHLHSAELEEGFSQGHPAEQHLPRNNKDRQTFRHLFSSYAPAELDN